MIESIKLLKKIIKKDPIYFVGEYSSYEDAAKHAKGYDADEIFDKCYKAAHEVYCGNGLFDRDGFTFAEPEQDLSLMCCLYMAYMCTGFLHVLDFGGAFGGVYNQHKRWLQSIENLKWYVVEQPRYVDAAEKMQNDTLKFVYSVTEINNCINCVLFRSSLEYLPKWKDALLAALEFKPEIVILDRTSVCDGGEWYSIQNVHEPIYEASYVIHVFDKRELIKAVTSEGYQLVQEFMPDHWQEFTISGKKVCEQSFVFQRVEC